MGSGSSKPKPVKATNNPQPKKNTMDPKPSKPVEKTPGAPAPVATAPGPVAVTSGQGMALAEDSADPHLAWRDVNVASLIHDHPDQPWWDIADMMVPQKPTVVKPDLLRRGWKTVRLFVSSTFKDMHSEREYLVKRIFPQLRQWCEERRLRLVECDLRWGVPKDASTRQTLLACLSEIDRCYEENEYPYILALLSDRYGWVPTENEVPPDIKHRYKWIPGMSVTTLEVMTGGLWANNPNALYMLRDPEYLKALENDPILNAYQEREEEYKKSLDVLKSKLQSVKTGGGKVSTYNCKVASKTDKRAELIGLEKFGEEVMSHFQQTLERQYPATSLGKELTEEEIQGLQHEVFMVQRSALLLGRDDVLAEVEGYINEEKSEPVPLVLIGYPGSGKSAVMATVSKRTVNRPECKVFYHFVGATPGSTDLIALLSRIWRELMPEEDKPPVDPNELRRSLGVVLENTSKTMHADKKTRIVLFIDALNQLDEDADEKVMDWLPRKLPQNVRIIVSTLEGPSLDALRMSKLPEVLVAPLSEDTRRSIVTQVLSEYNKSLDEEQLSLLVSKEDAGRPLYLTIACEELRVFGEFRKLTQKVKDLSQDLTNLLIQVLDRIIAENGGDLVVATLCFIECSRFGLLENELLQLLAPYSNMGSESEIDRLPMAEWAVVYLGLRQFLRPAGGSGEGRLDFYHRTISKCVRTKYLNEAQKITWHKKLTENFQNSTDLDRRAEELPYQLMQVGDVEGLKKALVENSMFERLYTPTSKQNLMTYWTYAGGYKIAAEMHLQALNSYLQENKSTLSAEAALAAQTKMVNFFTDIGEYEKAEKLLEKVITSTSEQFGAESKELCGPLFAAVILFYLQGIKVVYSNDPVYKRCSKLGGQYAKQCYTVHKKHFKKDDVQLGRVLTKCGYFVGSYLTEAKEICMSRSQQDYAEILYMLGEKNQYQTITISEGLFEESLKLCLNHFGFYHLNTARCYQLYGQLYWNQHTSMSRTPSYMVKCLSYYEKELDILETLLGAVHPTTVRSREDVIIILQTLDRHQEAAVLQEKQPE